MTKLLVHSFVLRFLITYCIIHLWVIPYEMTYCIIKLLLGYIPNYNNAKSLACDTANEHALTCTGETCSCSQTAVQ